MNKELILKVLSIMPGTKEILNNTNVTIKEKMGIGNIVTATDKRLEKYLKNSLLEIFPDSQIISEESAEKIKVDSNDGLKFMVDPIDGTTNFTNNWPHTVSIGIANNNELIGGVIYDVLKNMIFFSIKGKGVYSCSIDNITSIENVIQPKYETAEIKKSIISYDTPYGAEAFKVTSNMMSNLYYAGASLKIVGPISLDVLKTALGKENRPNDYNNAVWHTEVRSWDLAASVAILRELGGEIIGKDGKPLSIEALTSPTEKITFIASGNRKIIELLYEIYKQSEKSVNNVNCAKKD